MALPVTSANNLFIVVGFALAIISGQVVKIINVGLFNVIFIEAMKLLVIIMEEAILVVIWVKLCHQTVCIFINVLKAIIFVRVWLRAPRLHLIPIIA